MCSRWAEFDRFFAEMATTYEPGLQLDRRDNDGPYSPENCRWLTRVQNNWNKGPARRTTSSKYIGVCYNKRQNQWTAGVRVNGRRRHLGTFQTELEAARAYNQRCSELRGNMARLNRHFFPDDFLLIPSPVHSPLSV